MPAETVTRRRPSLLLLVFVVPALAVVAAVTTRVVAGPTTSTATPAAPNTVVIKNFAFSPASVSLGAGARLVVVNRDGTPHTLTSPEGGFDTGVLNPGQRATITVKRAGSFRFFCAIHNSMTGMVVAR